MPQNCNLFMPPGNPINNNTCPNDWVVHFLQPFFSTAAGWSVPSGVNYGITVNSKEMPPLSTSPPSPGYAATFASSGFASSVQMGLDMYDFSPNKQSLYACTIGNYQTCPTSGPSTCPAPPTGCTTHNVFVEEFGPQSWTMAGGPSGEGCAIIGLQSCSWNMLNQNLFASLLSFLAAQGVTDASLYGAEILGACTPFPPDNGQDNDVLASVTTAMQKQQYSMASSGLAVILSRWHSIGIVGCTLNRGYLVP